jgi:hypothetical protein
MVYLLPFTPLNVLIRKKMSFLIEQNTLRILVVWILSYSICGLVHAQSSRQADVASRGAKVMPFELSKTRHEFSKTEKGGIQRVVVRDSNDQQQIRLIRQHLTKLAAQFKQRDFSGPARIHGENMPGLAALRTAGNGDLQIHFHELPDGGSLEFITARSELVQAIHAWFDAQLFDHGSDATEMHEHFHH